MEFGIEKCAILVINKGKRETFRIAQSRKHLNP